MKKHLLQPLFFTVATSRSGSSLTLKSIRKYSINAFMVIFMMLFLFSCSEDDSVSLPEITVEEVWTSGFSLDWTVVDGNVIIQVSESEFFETFVLDTSLTKTSALEVAGLKSNTTYYFRYNVNQSDFSDTVPIQTSELETPGNILVERILGDEIHLTWDEVRGAIFEIQISTSEDFQNLLSGFENLKTSNSKIIIEPLEILTDYYLRLRSVNGEEASDWGNIGNVTTTDELLLTLRSKDFPADGKIPGKFSCDSSAPEMNWKNPPDGVQSFAIIMIDLDFQNGFNHWILFDIPSTITSIPAGTIPAGSKHGSNDLGGPRYFGPCPPSGEVHRYIFTLYALSEVLDFDSSIRNDEFKEGIKDYIISTALLRAEYR